MDWGSHFNATIENCFSTDFEPKMPFSLEPLRAAPDLKKDNQVKLATKKTYGFRTHEAIKTTFYNNLGALPEPNFTRKFW